eukprot:752557-Hanusia_phi.AAC.1
MSPSRRLCLKHSLLRALLAAGVVSTCSAWSAFSPFSSMLSTKRAASVSPVTFQKHVNVRGQAQCRKQVHSTISMALDTPSKPEAASGPSIFEKVSDSMKAAMKNKDKDRLAAVRAVKNALQTVAKDKRLQGQDALDDKESIVVLRKLAKQRQESIEAFEKGGRADLVEKEQPGGHPQVIPRVCGRIAPLTLECRWVEGAIASTGAKTPKEMGKVMKDEDQRKDKRVWGGEDEDEGERKKGEGEGEGGSGEGESEMKVKQIQVMGYLMKNYKEELDGCSSRFSSSSSSSSFPPPPPFLLLSSSSPPLLSSSSSTSSSSS